YNKAGDDMLKDINNKMPVISTTNTSGLTSVFQLVDNTSNELFKIGNSTSKNEGVRVVVPHDQQP
ncbi:unnamed protein product, partial [marine sediment metagenome]